MPKWEIIIVADLDTITMEIMCNSVKLLDKETLAVDDVEIKLPFCEVKSIEQKRKIFYEGNL